MSKINSGTVLLGFFALLFGLVGTWAVREFSKPVPASQKIAPPPQPPKTYLVPMASRNLDLGDKIGIDDIALIKMTRKDMQAHGVKSAYMSKAAQIVGKIVATSIERGDTFDTRQFFPEGQAPGIATRIEPGDRAVTISLTPTNALLGFAGAGQNVDVLFHYGEHRPVESQDNESLRVTPNEENWRKPFQSATVTLVENARILALGDHSVPTDDANGLPRSERVLVTLAVSPGEAEAIRVADGNGELSLSLRNPDDQSVKSIGKPKFLSEIIDVEPRIQQMEVVRGNQTTAMEFISAPTGPKSPPGQRQGDSFRKRDSLASHQRSRSRLSGDHRHKSRGASLRRSSIQKSTRQVERQRPQTAKSDLPSAGGRLTQ